MDPVPFVDAHVHFWDLAHIRYPWLAPPFDDDGPNGSVRAIARDLGPADYRAALARWNVMGAVHVEAGADPGQALDETAWLEALAREGGLPTAIVAYAALENPEVDRLLAAQAAHPRVRGIRQIVNWHPDPRRRYAATDLTRDPRWQAGYAQLARNGLSFDLQCYPDQMAGMAELIARHPDVPVVVNHLGMPVVSDSGGIASWRAGMAALAALAHVAVKLSGLGFIARDWTAETVRPFLVETIDLFGPDRCLFASDWATDTLFAPIHRYLETYHAVVADFTLDERRAMFGGNANRIYRLGLEL